MENFSVFFFASDALIGKNGMVAGQIYSGIANYRPIGICMDFPRILMHMRNFRNLPLR